MTCEELHNAIGENVQKALQERHPDQRLAYDPLNDRWSVIRKFPWPHTEAFSTVTLHLGDTPETVEQLEIVLRCAIFDAAVALANIDPCNIPVLTGENN